MPGCRTSAPTPSPRWSWRSASRRRRSPGAHGTAAGTCPRGSGPRMILLVVAPPREHAVYLQAIAAFARALSRPELAAALVAAQSAEEVLALPGLRRGRARRPAPRPRPDARDRHHPPRPTTRSTRPPAAWKRTRHRDPGRGRSWPGGRDSCRTASCSKRSPPGAVAARRRPVPRRQRLPEHSGA